MGTGLVGKGGRGGWGEGAGGRVIEGKMEPPVYKYKRILSPQVQIISTALKSRSAIGAIRWVETVPLNYSIVN